MYIPLLVLHTSTHFCISELTHFVKTVAERLHAASLEVILVVPAMKRGYVFMWELQIVANYYPVSNGT